MTEQERDALMSAVRIAKLEGIKSTPMLRERMRAHGVDPNLIGWALKEWSRYMDRIQPPVRKPLLRKRP